MLNLKINTPRTRTAEALKLLNHMSEFLIAGPVVNDIFTKKENVSKTTPGSHKTNSIMPFIASRGC